MLERFSFFQQQEGVINQQKKGKKTLAGVEKAKYLPTVEVLVCNQMIGLIE
jgi:hypothetical protein